MERPRRFFDAARRQPAQSTQSGRVPAAIHPDGERRRGPIPAGAAFRIDGCAIHRRVRAPDRFHQIPRRDSADRRPNADWQMGLALEHAVAAKRRDPQGATRIHRAGWRSSGVLLFAEESVKVIDKPVSNYLEAVAVASSSNGGIMPKRSKTVLVQT